MTTENKLIAEFMGYDDGTISPIKFNSDWTCLMPVVEQIENFGFEFIIAESRVKIKHNTDHSIKELLNIDIIGTKIESTYKAVVQFIREYNKLNK
tara:strand:- start:212 stop:496 length:285 start_codon:yes stop_codon:yes gene_type:complete